MPELRWILLGAGVIFLAVLAVWESRRQRRLPPQLDEPTQHRFREPTIGLPEIRPRESAPDLPVVEIDDSMIGLRVDGVRIEENMVAVDEPSRAPVAEPPMLAADHAAMQRPAPAEPAGLSANNAANAHPVPEPVVAWPPEEERRLVAVRVVARPGEKLSGRAVRLALGAEGFVHSKYAIFHKAGPDARVVVSAASLTKPGSFDLDTMDSQRYGGLGLFTVLPGHLPAGQMLDELLEAARNLSERLEGALQDERGGPLDAERIAALRATATGVASASAAAPAPDSAIAPQPAGPPP